MEQVNQPVADSEVAGKANKTMGSDSLLEALLIIARSHGTAVTRDTVLSGLPLEKGGLSPSLFERAARRAGLTSNIVQQGILSCNTELFPAILLLDNNEACLLVGLDASQGQASVVFPVLGDAVVDLPIERLEARYTGWIIYARPRFRFDARTEDVAKERERHWFWGVVSDNRRVYRDILLAAVLINLFAVAMPLFVLNVYDRVVPNHATETLWVLTIGILLVLGAELVLRVMRGYFVDLAASRTDVQVSANLMEHVMGMRMESRPPSAGSFASNLGAFESVRSFIGSATVVSFVDLPFVLLFMGVIAYIALPLAVPVLVGALIVLVYAMTVQRSMHDLARTTQRASARRNASLVESLVGIESIKSFNAEGRTQRIWENATAFLARKSAQQRLLSTSVTSVATWGQHTVSVMVILLGVYLIIEGELSHGGLIACYLLSSRAMAPISRAASLLTHYHQAETALNTLDNVMDKPVERPVDSTFISRSVFKGGIEFKNVSFKYPDEERVALDTVSFRIEPGEHVAILGRIGSGKTTVERLILGLYQPTDGSILVDGIDSRQIDPAELRRNIGYVPQDVTLFYGTLRDNIVIAAPMADDETVLQAVNASGLNRFIDSHPRGLSMQVGERGESLSGGQRQSVALARAVINDAPVLLLDEPTGSMDHSTEEEAKARLTELSKGKTMIVVTHRTSLLELVDRIIILDAGRVVADGPKEQVVSALRHGRIGKSSQNV